MTFVVEKIYVQNFIYNVHSVSCKFCRNFVNNRVSRNAGLSMFKLKRKPA